MLIKLSLMFRFSISVLGSEASSTSKCSFCYNKFEKMSKKLFMGDVITLYDDTFRWIVGDIDNVMSSNTVVRNPDFAHNLKFYNFDISLELEYRSNALDLTVDASHFSNKGFHITVSLLNCKSENIHVFYMNQFGLHRDIKGFVQKDMLDDRVRYDFSKPLTIKIEMRPSFVNILENPREFQTTNLQFEGFFDNSDLSDIKIIVDGISLHAHRVILSAASPVFTAMFRHQMTEMQQGVIHIADMTYGAVKEMLRFIYTGNIKFIELYKEELLAAAEKYCLQRLKYECAEHLCNTIKLDNVVKYLELADLYSIEELKKLAIEFVVDNGLDMLDEPDFDSLATLPADVVTDLIRTFILGVE